VGQKAREATKRKRTKHGDSQLSALDAVRFGCQRPRVVGISDQPQVKETSNTLQRTRLRLRPPNPKSCLIQSVAQTIWSPLADVIRRHISRPRHSFLSNHRVAIGDDDDDSPIRLEKLAAGCQHVAKVRQMLEHLKERDDLKTACLRSRGFSQGLEHLNPTTAQQLSHNIGAFRRESTPDVWKPSKKLSAACANIQNLASPWERGKFSHADVKVPLPARISTACMKQSVKLLVTSYERITKRESAVVASQYPATVTVP
jgi:hypothetical protein